MDYGLQPITDIKTYKLQTRKVFGWGISHPDEEIPTYAKFGTLVILLNKFFIKFSEFKDQIRSYNRWIEKYESK